MFNRKLKKELRELKAHAEMLTESVDRVVNQLNLSTVRCSGGRTFYDISTIGVPTLKGKIDAIVEHLGIDISVSPESYKPARVVVKVLHQKPSKSKK